MKYIPPAPGSNMPCIELTRRNLNILLEKLDDDASHKTIVDPDWQLMVTAVEEGGDDPDSPIQVKAVEDIEHYGDRSPGVMYMPSTGEYK